MTQRIIAINTYDHIIILSYYHIILYNHIIYEIFSENASFIKNMLLQNNKISVSIVKRIILYISLLFSVYYEPNCISNIVHVST